MKNLSLFKILIISAITFVSCTKDNDLEETCTKENFVVSFDRLVKKRTKQPAGWNSIGNTLEFTYNEFNLLSKTQQVHIERSSKIDFDYGCNNNISERYQSEYSYNSENKLTEVYDRGNASSYNLSYNENSVEVNGGVYIAGVLFKDYSDIYLELNVNNLVTKITRKNNYSVLEYDANENLILAKDYNLNDELLKTFELAYDQNPNPYYGQLKSVYLDRVLTHFYDSAQGAMVRISSADVDNVFPYFKNNVIKIAELSNSSLDSVFLERDFTYDEEDYPIMFQYKIYGYSDGTVEITYQDE
ncbi:MAG: hypothetical protein P8P88_06050 [Polaribacter sp.]|nr:hypothetical protein [Polaribacter sp.]